MQNQTSVVFWHLYVDVLNKEYGGALQALQALQQHPGVLRVDILPFERPVLRISEEEYYDLLSALAAYKDGPIAKY